MGYGIVESPIFKFVTIPILILFICVGFAVSNFSEGERDSLMKLKAHLDPNQKTILQRNWTGDHCSENVSHWIGVECLDGRAIQLFLEGIRFDGSIPSDIFANVTELRGLSFKNNSLEGILPDFSKFHLIKKIDFSYNKLNGSIPLTLVNSSLLRELYLENNELTGSIPAFNQTSLKVFNVSNNHLTGSIPNTSALNSFDESAYLGNDLMCGTKLSHNCSNPISPSFSPSPSPSPSPSSSPSPSPIRTKIRKKRGLPKDILSLIFILSAAVVLIVTVLFASLYQKFISPRE